MDMNRLIHNDDYEDPHRNIMNVNRNVVPPIDYYPQGHVPSSHQGSPYNSWVPYSSSPSKAWSPSSHVTVPHMLPPMNYDDYQQYGDYGRAPPSHIYAPSDLDPYRNPSLHHSNPHHLPSHPPSGYTYSPNPPPYSNHPSSSSHPSQQQMNRSKQTTTVGRPVEKHYVDKRGVPPTRKVKLNSGPPPSSISPPSKVSAPPITSSPDISSRRDKRKGVPQRRKTEERIPSEFYNEDNDIDSESDPEVPTKKHKTPPSSVQRRGRSNNKAPVATNTNHHSPETMIKKELGHLSAAAESLSNSNSSKTRSGTSFVPSNSHREASNVSSQSNRRGEESEEEKENNYVEDNLEGLKLMMMDEENDGRIDEIEGFFIICDDQPTTVEYNEFLRKSGERAVQRRATSTSTSYKDSKYKEVDSEEDEEEDSWERSHSPPPPSAYSYSSKNDTEMTQKIINALRYFGGKSPSIQIVDYVNANLNTEKINHKTLTYRINALLSLKKNESIFSKTINAAKTIWNLNEGELKTEKSNPLNGEEEPLDIEGFSNEREEKKNGGPKTIVTPHGVVVDQTDLLPYHNTMGCRVCRQTSDANHILLCDGCDDEYHLYCLVPSLLKIPKGQWYCPRCTQKDSSELRSSSEGLRRSGSGAKNPSSFTFATEHSVLEALAEMGGQATGMQIRDKLAKSFGVEEENRTSLLKKINSILIAKPHRFEKNGTQVENQKRTSIWRLVNGLRLSDLVQKYENNESDDEDSEREEEMQKKEDLSSSDEEMEEEEVKPEPPKPSQPVQTIKPESPQKETTPVKEKVPFSIPKLNSILDPLFPPLLPVPRLVKEKKEKKPKEDTRFKALKEVYMDRLRTTKPDITSTEDLLEVVTVALLELNNSATADVISEWVGKHQADRSIHYDPASLRKRICALLSSRFHQDVFVKGPPNPADPKNYVLWSLSEDILNGKAIQALILARKLNSAPMKERKVKEAEEKKPSPKRTEEEKKRMEERRASSVSVIEKRSENSPDWVSIIKEVLKQSLTAVSASELPVTVASMVDPSITLKNVKYNVANALQKNTTIFEKTVNDNKTFWSLQK